MNVSSQETSVGICPICGDEFPMAKLCVHASSCNGKTQPAEKSQAVFPSNQNGGGISMKRKNTENSSNSLNSSPSSFFKKFKDGKDNKLSQDCQPFKKGSPDQKPNNMLKVS